MKRVFVEKGLDPQVENYCSSSYVSAELPPPIPSVSSLSSLFLGISSESLGAKHYNHAVHRNCSGKMEPRRSSDLYESLARTASSRTGFLRASSSFLFTNAGHEKQQSKDPDHTDIRYAMVGQGPPGSDCKMGTSQRDTYWNRLVPTAGVVSH